MSNRKFPTGIDSAGKTKSADEFRRGEIAKCFDCKQPILIKAEGPVKGGYLKTILGAVHTGIKCKIIQKGKAKKIGLINVKRVLQKRSRKANPEDNGDHDKIKNPRKSRGEGDTVYLYDDFSSLVNSDLREKADFAINEYEKLTDSYVSLTNARVIMENNRSLFSRFVEAYLDYVFPGRHTIRVLSQAKRYQNDRPTAAQKVLDLQCESMEVFDAAARKLFIRYLDSNGNLIWLPRYRKIFAGGVYHAIRNENCHGNNECVKNCESFYTHCTGRQAAVIRDVDSQIIVCEADKIDYSIYNGWIPQTEKFM